MNHLENDVPTIKENIIIKETNKVCKPEKKIKYKTSNKTLEIDYHKYYTKKKVLSTFKIPELKEIAKYNHIQVGGNKPQLIQRIDNYFIKVKNIIKIQATFRRYLVLLSFRLRGPAYKERSICVNDTDFYTLEHLTEIDSLSFFSYKDNKGFVYGFDMNSLVTLFVNSKSSKTRMNPYNRELFSDKTILNIIKLNRIHKIIFHSKKEDIPQNNISINPTNNVINITTNTYLERENIINRKLEQIRNNDLPTRIRELFIEIDILGNYTDNSWLYSLEDTHCLRYYRYFRIFWENTIPYDIRRKITPFYNPLSKNLEITHVVNQIGDVLKSSIVTIFENVIYGTDDIEYRKLGALQLLTVLTTVSVGARRSLPWLYESINF